MGSVVACARALACPACLMGLHAPIERSRQAFDLGFAPSATHFRPSGD